MHLTHLSLSFFISATALAQSSYSYLPNPALTPGLAATTNVDEVCAKDYPKKARKVSEQTKSGVYYRYGVDQKECVDGCKIDHLIPLAIGGSNQVRNLWPHEYGAQWSVYKKTRLEVRLRREVCAGQLDIIEAQECIATDWTKCYQKFFY